MTTPVSSQTSSKVPEKEVVLLVHGVGDTESGDMVDTVAPAVAQVHPTLEFQDYDERVQLPDSLPEDRTPCEPFPVFSRRTKAVGSQVVFTEVYWADLSRIREGSFELLLGVFRLLFGLRFVTTALTKQPGWIAGLLGWLLYLAVLLLRGPLLALFVLGAVYATLIAVVRDLQERGLWVPLTAGPDAVKCFGGVGLACAILGLGLLVWGLVRQRRLRFRALAVWLTLAGLAAAALAFRIFTAPGAPPLPLLVQRIDQQYAGQISSPDTCEFFLGAIHFLIYWLNVAAAGLLGTALGVLLVGYFFVNPNNRPGLGAALLTTALQMTLWRMILAPLELEICWVLSARFTTQIDAPILNQPLQYFKDLMFLPFVLVGSISLTWAARLIWSWNHGIDSWPEKAPPRLILGASDHILLLLASLVLCFFPIPLPNDVLIPIAGLATLVVGVIVFVRVQWLRNWIHIMMDIVNHFHRPEGRFPTRRRIEARFRAVLERILQVERPTYLTILAHSQGTMIALSVLAEQPLKTELQELREVKLVTFGSPFSHLYQHYFPYQYPPLHRPPEGKLACSRWVNLFRIDDFVGTHIDSGDGDLKKQQWPENVPLPKGGTHAHVSYWELPVLSKIADLLPGRSRVASNGASTKATAEVPQQHDIPQQPAIAQKPLPGPTETQGPPILFACSNCGTKLRVEANLAGKKIKCPKCLTILTVPLFDPFSDPFSGK